MPEQKALSGFRSRELTPGGGNAAGGRSNHLILDDTEQKIQAQLRSDHQHSQLGLGHLTRIEGHEGRKDERGEGFELRTDGHGAIRAKEGLLISTEGRPNARAHAKDMGETTSRLSEGQSQHESLGELAQQHRAQEAQDQADVAASLQAQNEAIAGKHAEGAHPELSEPHLVLASPAGIESTTAGSTHQHSTKHHAITTGGHASVSAGKSWLVSAKEAIKLFAHKQRMRLSSAQADIEIQALQKSLNLLSKLDISMTADRITINATEEVVINGGGSYTIWNASGITSGTTGTHTVQAASHKFLPGQSMPVQALPETTPFNEVVELRDKKGRPVTGLPYRLELGNHRELRGATDSHGRTQRVGSGEAAAQLHMHHDRSQ